MIFDVHLDLSLNALEWNRDLRLSIQQIREEEADRSDLAGRGQGTVCFPEMRKGGIGLCVATQIGGCMKPRGPVASWESPPQAWAMTQGQLAWYRAMEEEGEIRQIRNREDLANHLTHWEADPKTCPIGYIMSLEGADSIITLAYLERAWEDGLRAIGPAHYGKGRYALGHDQDGPISREGRELLSEMDRLELILDVTHLCDQTFWDALELYEGPIWASHSNCRALVDDVRQFSDEQIQALIDRGAVIGAPLDAWMMIPGWERGKTMPSEAGIKIAHAVDHMDHICQLAGNAKHIGIGSDLDGGFGREQSPSDLDTIADLTAVEKELRRRGYSKEDANGAMSGQFPAISGESMGNLKSFPLRIPSKHLIYRDRWQVLRR